MQKTSQIYSVTSIRVDHPQPQLISEEPSGVESLPVCQSARLNEVKLAVLILYDTGRVIGNLLMIYDS